MLINKGFPDIDPSLGYFAWDDNARKPLYLLFAENINCPKSDRVELTD